MVTNIKANTKLDYVKMPFKKYSLQHIGGIHKTLIVHLNKTGYGNKKHYTTLGNFITRNGEIIMLLEEEQNFNNYNNINLN